MGTPSATTQYKNHRFPAESISYAVWLYFRSSLSFHEVEKLLLEHEMVVTYEAIRKLLKGLSYVPRMIITDKLKSYGAAQRKIFPGVEPRQDRYLNNRRRTPM